MPNKEINNDSVFYSKQILINNISNTFLKLIFNSFNLMFKQTVKVSKDKLISITLNYIDLGGKENVSFKFQTTRSNNIFFNTYIDDKIVDECYVRYSLENQDEETLIQFISICISLGLQKLLDHVNIDAEIEVNATITDESGEKTIHTNGILSGPPDSYTKKIKSIFPAEELQRYQVLFEDGSSHFIITHAGIDWQWRAGDYAHNDGNGGFVFINSNLFQ